MKGWSIVLLLVVGSVPLHAQRSELVVRGHVVRQTIDGPVAMPRSLVTLHRIGPIDAGPVDSAVTDRTGEFVFRFEADSSSMYLATARHAGIAYFAPPSRLDDVGGESEIVVFDTTSGPVSLHISGRHLVVSAPNARGHREIVEVYEIQNDTIATLISGPDRPTFRAPIPQAALNPRVNQGDFTGAAVRFSPGLVDIMSPIAPGVRQLVVAYELTAGDFPMSLGLDASADLLEVLLEEPEGKVEGTGLDARGAVDIDGRTFQRYMGRDLPPGAAFTIVAPTRSASFPGWLPGLILGVSSLGIVVFFSRRRPRAAGATVAGTTGPADWDADQLREAIAGVDTALASHETNDAARPALLAYREELEEALDRELAAPQSAS